MNPLPLLSVKGLSLSDQKRVLFEDIAFDLFPGEVLALMGPSGTGKSMLSKAIAGFLPTDVEAQGSIEIDGIDVSHTPMLQRNSLQRPAVIFQDALKSLNPLASIEHQLSLAYSSGKTRLNGQGQSAVFTLLKKLGFSDPDSILHLYPSQLSGGQRQRICIAMALLGQSNILFADELTSALDPITEQEILSLFLKSVKERNIGGVLITHDLNSALACDKILVIADGTPVAYGKPRTAIKASQHTYCVELTRLLAE
ncbi:ABC transporter ATP-binding protein [Vibrio sp. RE86]|uniref:ATP-binding cassette domain-containing protein n=1 Tax=Vibrio sp. RE86 TaxID=2607605 RepID=UPI0014937C12|nr:ABC transporter ATP-binding protein [Vibrio sp. RE86]